MLCYMVFSTLQQNKVQLLQLQKPWIKWPQNGMGIAASRAVGCRAAKIAHMRIRKDVHLKHRQKKKLLVDIMFKQWQIRMVSQQSIWAWAKPELSSHQIPEMGRVTGAMSPIRCAKPPLQTEPIQQSPFSFPALLYPAVDSNQVHLNVQRECYMCGMALALDHYVGSRFHNTPPPDGNFWRLGWVVSHKTWSWATVVVRMGTLYMTDWWGQRTT
jgi:hypothetical protein